VAVTSHGDAACSSTAAETGIDQHRDFIAAQIGAAAASEAASGCEVSPVRDERGRASGLVAFATMLLAGAAGRRRRRAH